MQRVWKRKITFLILSSFSTYVCTTKTKTTTTGLEKFCASSILKYPCRLTYDFQIGCDFIVIWNVIRISVIADFLLLRIHFAAGICCKDSSILPTIITYIQRRYEYMLVFLCFLLHLVHFIGEKVRKVETKTNDNNVWLCGKVGAHCSVFQWKNTVRENMVTFFWSSILLNAALHIWFGHSNCSHVFRTHSNSTFIVDFSVWNLFLFFVFCLFISNSFRVTIGSFSNCKIVIVIYFTWDVFDFCRKFHTASIS